MSTESQPQNGGALFTLLDAAIEATNHAKRFSFFPTATVIFGTVSTILTMIKGSMHSNEEYVGLGLFCADICKALERGMNGKTLDDLNQSTRDAIDQLMTTVARIKMEIDERCGRSAASRLVSASSDSEKITAWKSELNRILIIFNTELLLNTHTMVADMYQSMFKTRVIGERFSNLDHKEIQYPMSAYSIPGESPPPPSKIFGRDKLVNKIVDSAERLSSIALVGACGIGKTSIALTALHDDRIKQRFGEDRRFIRCDKFPPSLRHFLTRLSEAIGAGVENPKDLAPLRPFLSSKEMFIVLDNAESILDPQGTSTQDIYEVVEELGQLSNICICITSRISTFPPGFGWLNIPTLPKGAAINTFHHVYKRNKRCDRVIGVLEQLDFHALSITLLATVAHHNKWSTGRLVSEWDERRTDVLQMGHRSLAATIELSLSSLTFQALGPNARDLLGVIAFFPQGIQENNIDWLFPTIDGRKNMFDKFRLLSLTHKYDGFITMLAPIRDYLSPKDPTSAQILCLIKERYFGRLSDCVKPDSPGSKEARWITSENVNIEHLLDVFTTADAASADVWDACNNFMKHLSLCKPRLTMLGPKIEALADDHPSKLKCLAQLSKLYQKTGNHAEYTRLLIHTLKLSKERAENRQLTQPLRKESGVPSATGLRERGIQQAREAVSTVNTSEGLRTTNGERNAGTRKEEGSCSIQ